MAILSAGGRKFFVIMVEFAFILLSGVLKHFLSGIPAEAMIGGSVTATLGYLSINYAQKRAEIRNAQKDSGESR